MYRAEILKKINHELSLAEAARQAGLEGRARVCARRAAGIAIREYLKVHQQPAETSNLYNLIRQLINKPNFSPEIQQIARHLAMRVNEDFNLPPEIDLIAETRRLISALDSSFPSSQGLE